MRKAKTPTKVVASALAIATATNRKQAHDYAIVSIIRGRRYYWCQATKSFGNWHQATHFSKNERKAYELPTKDAFWVTVLHGMGKDFYYAADSELNERNY